MVDVHGSGPHADGRAGLGDLGDSLGRELLHLDVGLDLLDDRFWNVVLVKVEEAVKELGWVVEDLLARVPVVGNLLAHLKRDRERKAVRQQSANSNLSLFSPC